MIYKKMIIEQDRLQRKIAMLKQKLKIFPAGKFTCRKNKNYIKWFVNIDGASEYIPKDDDEFAKTMALKRYYTELLENLEKELFAVETYLKHCPSEYHTGESSLLSRHGYKELLEAVFASKKESISTWSNEPYKSNPRYPEHLTVKTVTGTLVRSKSEALILTLLHTNNIPFRYECLLSINNTEIYPDFTIMHPITGEIYYWEHFGMMDNPSYANHAFTKLLTYSHNNIFPSINLITTYETSDSPLDLSIVQKLIEIYFLQ